MALDSSASPYYYYYLAYDGQDRQPPPYFYDERAMANIDMSYGQQMPAPVAPDMSAGVLGGCCNYYYHNHEDVMRYVEPRPSILAGEEWKVSSCPMSQSKPLPQEPPMPPPRSSLFMDTNNNNNYFYQQPQQPPAYHNESPAIQESLYPEEKPASEKNKKSTESNKKTGRQITVQSINKEHRVWITVEPTETGLSLAEKIKTIATFRTRKILSITTAAGRAVPLDNRPVFGSWMDMDSFQDGEQWKVEWGELDKSMVDRIFAKVLQVSSGGRRRQSK